MVHLIRTTHEKAPKTQNLTQIILTNCFLKELIHLFQQSKLWQTKHFSIKLFNTVSHIFYQIFHERNITHNFSLRFWQSTYFAQILTHNIFWPIPDKQNIFAQISSIRIFFAQLLILKIFFSDFDNFDNDDHFQT